MLNYLLLLWSYLFWENQIWDYCDQIQLAVRPGLELEACRVQHSNHAVACVASVSVLFRSKERPRNEILAFVAQSLTLKTARKRLLRRLITQPFSLETQYKQFVFHYPINTVHHDFFIETNPFIYLFNLLGRCLYFGSLLVS